MKGRNLVEFWENDRGAFVIVWGGEFSHSFLVLCNTILNATILSLLQN